MKKLFLSLLLILFFSLTTSSVYACQPCHHGGLEGIIYDTFTLPRLLSEIKDSELIIIGQRTDFHEKEFSGFGSSNKINVRKVLKGSVNTKEISVKTNYGMCPYGIFINNDKDYIMFLKGGAGVYGPTNQCGIKKLSFCDSAKIITGFLMLISIFVIITLIIVKRFIRIYRIVVKNK